MKAIIISIIACFALMGCVRDPYYYDDGPSYNVNRNVNRTRTVNRNVNRNVNRHHNHVHHVHHHHGHR